MSRTWSCMYNLSIWSIINIIITLVWSGKYFIKDLLKTMVNFSVVMWKAQPSHPLHLDMTGWVFPSLCLAQFNVTRWVVLTLLLSFQYRQQWQREIPLSFFAESTVTVRGISPHCVVIFIFQRQEIPHCVVYQDSSFDDDQGNLPLLYCSYHSFFTNGPRCFFHSW